jgi:hypothetical protein
MPSEKILRERMKFFVLQDIRVVYYRRLVPGKQLVFKISVEIGIEKNKDQRTNLHGRW